MKVLVTGATGLVGKTICKELLARGEELVVLSRRPHSFMGTDTYVWDYKKEYIDTAALQGLDAIIHLAGAPVANRWTDDYKKEILDSRVKTTELLFQKCAESNEFPKVFISASGSSYYGQITRDRPFKEEEPAGADFIAKVAEEWEKTADLFQAHSRVVKIRTGLVLASNGGALEKMLPAAKMGLLSPLGSGKQYFPWVHISDLVGIYMAALYKEEAQGAYNAAAPVQTNNIEFSKALLKVLGRSMIFPKVPPFVLKLALGEMSMLLLKGSPLDAEKVERNLYAYQHRDVEKTLKDLLN